MNTQDRRNKKRNRKRKRKRKVFNTKKKIKNGERGLQLVKKKISTLPDFAMNLGLILIIFSRNISIDYELMKSGELINAGMHSLIRGARIMYR